MVDLTEGAKPIDTVDREAEARRIWGDDAMFCHGVNKDWGSGQHAPGWHHRVYHHERPHPRWSIYFAWYDLWLGGYYDTLKRTWYVCLIPTLVIEYRRKPR